jgi:hypothetical protein
VYTRMSVIIQYRIQFCPVPGQETSKVKAHTRQEQFRRWVRRSKRVVPARVKEILALRPLSAAGSALRLRLHLNAELKFRSCDRPGQAENPAAARAQAATNAREVAGDAY